MNKICFIKQAQLTYLPLSMKVFNITKGILKMRLISTSEIKRKAAKTFSEEQPQTSL